MALKKKLTQTAKENTTVTKGTSKSQETLKSGTPNDHTRKHQSNEKVVGVSVGVTKNMDNYESLRVDCWLTDTVQEGETEKQAFERVLGVVDEVLQDTVQSYTEEE